MIKLEAVFALVLFAASTVSVSAFADSSKHVKRAGKWDSTILLRNQSSETFGGPNGAEVDFGSDNGWGFSLGYNFDEHLSLGIEITANNSDYSVVFEDKNGDIKRFDHNADFYSTTFNLRYHFLEGPVQPFIMAGLGWTSVDSNISTGKGYCVPDYYWGWYCYQTSYSETGMSYSTAAGVRVELPNRLFLRASYGMQWLNEDIGDDSTNFDVGLLELGIVF